LRLAELERLFWRACRYDPAPPEVVEAFVGDERLDAFGRMAIYRQMYWFRQVEALRDGFPRLLDALGEEQFTKLACSYIVAHPSTHPALEWLGRALPGYLAAHPREDVPCAGEIAALEWAESEALLALDGPPAIDVEGVRAIPPERFAASVLRFSGSLRVVEASREAVERWSGKATSGDRLIVAVWRPRYGVEHVVLDEDEARALALARAGRPVAEVVEAFGAADSPVERAFGALLSWVNRAWIIAVETDNLSLNESS
jgi:hypothetical protein